MIQGSIYISLEVLNISHSLTTSLMVRPSGLLTVLLLSLVGTTLTTLNLVVSELKKSTETVKMKLLRPETIMK